MGQIRINRKLINSMVDFFYKQKISMKNINKDITGEIRAGALLSSILKKEGIEHNAMNEDYVEDCKFSDLLKAVRAYEQIRQAQFIATMQAANMKKPVIIKGRQN